MVELVNAGQVNAESLARSLGYAMDNVKFQIQKSCDKNNTKQLQKVFRELDFVMQLSVKTKL